MSKRFSSRGARVLWALALLHNSASAQPAQPPVLLEGQALELASPEPFASVTASVVVELLIDAAGAVSSAQVVQSDAPEEAALRFAELATQHALQLRFVAAQQDGVAIASKLRVELRFVAMAANEPVAPPIAEAEAGPEPESGSESGSESESGSGSGSESESESESESGSDSSLPELAAEARVAGGAAPALPSAASEYHLELGALRHAPRRQAQQYLTLTPGVVLQNHSGTGHANAVLLRGFDAGEGEDMEVRADGIPLNEPSNAHSHGYADTGFLIPEVIDAVDVVQGPFDPRQGDFAIAGSSDYRLGVEQRGIRATLEYGRFDEKRGLLLWAPAEAERGTFVAVDFSDGDGFGPNRAHSAFRSLARYERGRGALRFSLLGAVAAARFDSAGIVREDDYEARALPCEGDADSQFFCTYDPNQGGSSARGLLSGSLSYLRPGRTAALQLYLGRRAFRERDDFTGFLLDARGDGVEERYDADTFGLRGSYALEREALGQTQRVELGVEGRQDLARTRMWRLRRVGAAPYATIFDTDLSLTHGAAYLRGELSPWERLTFVGGLRADAFGFATVDLAAPETDRVGERLPVMGRDAWGTALSPRGSLRVRVLEPLTWVVSAGTGVRSSDAQALSQGEAAPFARALSTETGPVLELAPVHDWKLRSQAFGFITRVERDLLFDPERGRNVPVGASSRAGVGGSARLQIEDVHDSLLSLSYAQARALPDGGGFFALDAGEVLPFVPRFVMRFDHASVARVRWLGRAITLTGALGVGFIGERPLPLGTRSEPLLDVGLNLLARVDFVELGLSIENLLDARHRVSELNYASQFDADAPASLRAVRHFAAGAPRTFLLSLTCYFDEPELAEGEAS